MPFFSVLIHVGVFDVGEWNKGLLDGLGRRELEHVVRTAGLIIRA